MFGGSGVGGKDILDPPAALHRRQHQPQPLFRRGSSLGHNRPGGVPLLKGGRADGDGHHGPAAAVLGSRHLGQERGESGQDAAGLLEACADPAVRHGRGRRRDVDLTQQPEVPRAQRQGAKPGQPADRFLGVGRVKLSLHLGRDGGRIRGWRRRFRGGGRDGRCGLLRSLGVPSGESREARKRRGHRGSRDSPPGNEDTQDGQAHGCGPEAAAARRIPAGCAGAGCAPAGRVARAGAPGRSPGAGRPSRRKRPGSAVPMEASLKAPVAVRPAAPAP